MKRISCYLFLFLLLGAGMPALNAQVTLPQKSQKSVITQTIGLTDITITYHRPKVKGRTVFGEMVSINDNDNLEGKSRPWRAGANENTTVSFTHDVKVEGKTLAAGTYGLHMIPTNNKWTIAFSKNSTSWGSYSYNQEEDALRVKVMPKETSFHELLTYDVIDHTENGATIALSWEKMQVPIKVEVDVHNIVLQNMRNELRSSAGFTWQGWNTAAAYCANNDINHEEAMKWADQAMGRGGSFTAASTKAQLLTMTGEEEKANKLMGKMMNLATNAELNMYGYTLANQGKLDEAIEAFKLNVEKHPEDPNVHDSLGEGYTMRGADGDKKLAIKSFEKSLSMNPADNVKKNSIMNLKKLGVKKYMNDTELSKANK